MSKVILILDTIVTILMALCVIINVVEGNFGAAIMWNINFTLGLFNTTLDLLFGEIKKITTKLKEEDKK